MNKSNFGITPINNSNARFVQINNKYAVFSTLQNDVIFCRKNVKDPIFCGGIINNIGRNIYNFKVNQLVGYLSFVQNLNINLSPNLIINLSDKNNLKLISILPYASYVMKILRKINPKIGQQIIIIGLNSFSILLMKLLKLSGAYIKIIRLNTDLNNYRKKNNYENNIIDDLNVARRCLRDIELDYVILDTDSDQKFNEFLDQFNVKKNIYLDQISIYDKGSNDPDYIKGVVYPYSYIRWHFKSNLRYFVDLVKKNEIDLSFLEVIKQPVKSIEDMRENIKNIRKNKFILFEFQN